MSRIDKFYTSEDLTGYDLNDRLYSEEEVTSMNEMFEEFFSENSEYYRGDVDEAYSDFFDAYSAGIEDRTKENYVGTNETKKSKLLGRSLATVGGVGVGAGIGSILARKDRAKKTIIAKKISEGTANKQDLKELSSINARIKAKTLGAAALGGGVGYGTARILSKLNTK